MLEDLKTHAGLARQKLSASNSNLFS